MTRHFKDLRVLTELMKDDALMRVKKLHDACSATRRHIQQLDAPLPTEPALPDHILLDAAIRHARWVAPRRKLLNETLATQTAAHLAAQAEARRAFGRAMVADRIAAMKSSYPDEESL